MAGIPTGAVIALKQLDLAKSRFADTPPALRERLALAMLADTCRAVSGRVERLVVVTAVPGLHAVLADFGVEVLTDPGGGLNAAYARGAQALEDTGMERVLACVADLPALMADDIDTVLGEACGRRAYVADHTGRGTTMLVAPRGELTPLFEHGSAERHQRSGADPITADVPRARLDVDDPSDLAAAAELGLGAATARLWGEGRLATHTTAVVATRADDGWTVVLRDGSRTSVVREALATELVDVHPTQRLHLARVADEVRVAWL